MQHNTFSTQLMSDQKKKESNSILQLSSKIDKKVRVKFNGGRTAIGILKGYDELVNVVLDEAVEEIEHDSSQYIHFKTDKQNDNSPIFRPLGLIVCRGTQVSLINPMEGEEEIDNPFIGGGEEEDEGQA